MSRYAVAVFVYFDHRIHLVEVRASSKLEAACTVLAEVWKGEEFEDLEGELRRIGELETFEALAEYLNEDAIEVVELEESTDGT